MDYPAAVFLLAVAIGGVLWQRRASLRNWSRIRPRQIGEFLVFFWQRRREWFDRSPPPGSRPAEAAGLSSAPEIAAVRKRNVKRAGGGIAGVLIFIAFMFASDLGVGVWLTLALLAASALTVVWRRLVR
jgi:hypothetical protein